MLLFPVEPRTFATFYRITAPMKLLLPACLCLLLATGLRAQVAADSSEASEVHAEEVPPTADISVAQTSATNPAASAALDRSQTGGYFDAQAQTAERPSAEIRAGDAVSAVPKRFQYAFRLFMSGVYDDNIYLNQINKVSDFYFAIEPGITLGWGDIVGSEQNSIRLDYAPSIFLYADNSNANAVQNVIRIDGHYHTGHLSLALDQDIELLESTTHLGSTSGSVNTSQTPSVNLDSPNSPVNIYNTRGSFSYDLSGKTFLSGGVTFTLRDYEELIDSEDLTGNLFMNYIYSPKLTLGLGGTFGYNTVGGNNPDQTYEQVNLRGDYQLSGKVSLNASVGVEFRQFENDTTGTHVSPVYQLGLAYQPFDGTTIHLDGSRHTQNSAVFAGQDYDTTNINFGVRQRFLRRVYFGVNFGYEHSDYFNTVSFVNANRSDDYFFVQPSVDVTITRYWTAGAYYLHRRDDSSFSAYSFEDNQVGLRTSLTF